MKRSILPGWIGGVLASVAMGTLPAVAQHAETGGFVEFDAGVNLLNNVEMGTDDVAFDPGWRIGAVGGYRFNRFTRVGFETGFLSNEARHNLNGERLMQLPLLASVQFIVENQSRFVPYAGGGVGGAATFLGDDDTSDADFVFAWQAEAGVLFKISEDVAVGVAYKYFTLTSQDYELHGRAFEVDEVHNHMIGARLDWAF